MIGSTRKPGADESEDEEEGSMGTVAKSIVRLIRGNKMVGPMITSALTKALGGKGTAAADAVEEVIIEISKSENLDDAISRMKTLMMTNETIAKVVMTFMGGSEDKTQTQAENDPVYED